MFVPDIFASQDEQKLLVVRREGQRRDLYQAECDNVLV